MNKLLLERAQRILSTISDIELDFRDGAPEEESAGFDGIIDLVRARTSAPLLVEMASSVTAPRARKLISHWRAIRARDPNVPHLVVIADEIPAAARSTLREAGVNFIAADRGSVNLSFNDVVIMVDSTPPSRGAGGRRRGQSVSRPARQLFSPKRAQVVVALLAWPDLADQPVRSLSAAAGTSTGIAHGTLELLHDLAYLAGGSVIEPRRLLMDWGAAYPAGLAPSLLLQSWHRAGSSTSPHWVDTDGVVSGELAAARYLRGAPRELTIYVRDDQQARALAMANRWRRPHQGETADVTVRRRFWRVPQNIEPASEPPEQSAPWPLVYGDLLAAGDSRLRETALAFADDRLHRETAWSHP